MSELDELRARLEEIEARIEDRPGEALDELTALVGEMDAAIGEEIVRSERLLGNEDFPGAAGALGESAVVLQRTATVALALREAIRRRR